MNFVFIPCDLDRSISHKISRYDRHLPITAHASSVNTSEGNSRIQFAGRTHTSSIAHREVVRTQDITPLAWKVNLLMPYAFSEFSLVSQVMRLFNIGCNRTRFLIYSGRFLRSGTNFEIFGGLILLAP